jgi:DNA-binding LacI/PurR family transcriptional regulator
MRKRTTIKDIAAATGVSVAAVSAVISGKSGASIRVSVETRKKILDTARELEYMPDQRARTFREKRSRIITVITYESVFPVHWRNEFYGFFVGVEEEAAKRGYDILILNNKPDPSTAALRSINRIGIADGAVVIGISKDESSLIRFHHSGFPLIFVGRREVAGIVPNYATFDYETPIKDLITSIVSAGFTSVNYFAVGAGEPLIDKRRFIANACDKAGILIREFLSNALPSPEEAIGERNFLLFNTMACADEFRARADLRGFKASIDYQAAVLEDRWQDSDTFWTRLDSDRPLLGRTSVSCLVELISETAIEPIRTLIPVKLIPGSSSPLLFS